MVSVGKQSERITTESVKGLTFGQATIHSNYIDIDGYSNKKTIAGALNDLAKAVDNYDKGEGDYIRGMVSGDEMVQIHPDKNAGPGQYIIEWEDVPGATRYNEDTDEMEYKAGRWYVRVRIVR